MIDTRVAIDPDPVFEETITLIKRETLYMLNKTWFKGNIS